MSPGERAAELFRHALRGSLLSICLLVFIEWIFVATKPSFLSPLSWIDRFAVLFVAPLPFAVLAVGVLGLAFAIASLVDRTAARPLGVVFPALAALVPATFLTAGAILAVDHFTYTVLGFGVISSRGGPRVLYGLLMLATFLLFFLIFSRRLMRRRKGGSTPLWPVLVPCCVGALWALGSLASTPGVEQRQASTVLERPPDILLISGDGLEAARLGPYGNPISEMKLFRALGRDAVVFLNSFPNSNNTHTSTSMVLTGKYAPTTRTGDEYLFFQGLDAYQHLPGWLRDRGYRSIQVGGTRSVDAEFWGMRRAFDVQRDRNLSASVFNRLSERLGGRLNWHLHMSQAIYDQVRERVDHAVFSRLMAQPHLVAEGEHTEAEEVEMSDWVIDFLRANPGPVFVQLHSMATRLPMFRNNRMRTGRPGRLNDGVTRIVEELRAQGRFENSIIVIWSDHGWKYATNARLPLIIKFPTEMEIPRIDFNTQTLDIAPTIIAALGEPVPDWMEGRSLLSPISQREPIFSIAGSGTRDGIHPGRVKLGPRGFSQIGVIVCDRWYSLPLSPRAVLSSGTVRGYPTSCLEEPPSPSVAERMMLDHLIERGYGPALTAPRPDDRGIVKAPQERAATP